MSQTLDANLNVISEDETIEIQLLDGDLNIIQKLDDEPNDVGGLTAQELKAKFDESGNVIKKYINETLVPAVLAADATETARTAAENERANNEIERADAETVREQAEEQRNTDFEQMKTDTATALKLIEALKVAASTLAPGSAATIALTVDETTGGYVISFGIPQGKDGVDGTVAFEDLTDEQRKSLRGTDGDAATINGVNALTLAAEEPLALEQTGGTATLKLTGDVGVTVNEASATLTTSGWTTHSVLGYQQTVTVTGITAAAKAIDTDVELSTTDKDSNTAILAAYALIAANPATAGANKVTFYAESIPEVNVPVYVRWM